MPKAPEPELIRGPEVLVRYNISDMSLWRWLRDPGMNFPQPLYIGRIRYFRLAELEAWERGLPRQLAAEAEDGASAA